MPERRVQDASDPEFDEAVRLSGEALEHALRHRNAPRPRAYEVWYTYAAGEDAALRARVDSELIKTGGVDLETIEQIYEEHFLEKRLSRGISRIGDELDAGLKQAVAVVRDGLGASQRFIGSLTQAQERIEQSTNKGDAKRIVLKLLALSSGQVEQTKAVTAELTKVRAQVVELQAELLRLRDSAYLDHLTQIPNRRHMDEVLDREITVALLHGHPLSFALGDLDHFKKLNDDYGHAVGDALLKNFAALIKDNIKGQDTPARFGGEEFAIIFPKTSLYNAARVTDQIRKLLAETSFVLSRDRSSIGQVSVSFGVTQLLSTDSKDDLIKRADALLYRAKRLGRNRVETDL